MAGIGISSRCRTPEIVSPWKKVGQAPVTMPADDQEIGPVSFARRASSRFTSP